MFLPPLENLTKETICKFYLRKKCKHIKEKTTCGWKHPKMCFSWTKNGFCKDKNKCSQFLHPKLCESTFQGLICNKPKCFLYHIPSINLRPPHNPSIPFIPQPQSSHAPNTTLNPQSGPTLSSQGSSQPLNQNFPPLPQPKNPPVNLTYQQNNQLNMNMKTLMKMFNSLSAKVDTLNQKVMMTTPNL